MGPPWQPVIVVIHNDTNRPIKLIAPEGPRLGAGWGRIGHMICSASHKLQVCRHLVSDLAKLGPTIATSSNRLILFLHYLETTKSWI